MNRKQRGISFLISAVLTFGILMATVGNNFRHHCMQHFKTEQCHQEHINK
ncbi:MAG: hypothetical protein JNK41_10995 [Saprospiraceae bacterium]|nr:hypothetical protein [Saprospiraceae bacterium]